LRLAAVALSPACLPSAQVWRLRRVDAPEPPARAVDIDSVAIYDPLRGSRGHYCGKDQRR